MKNILLILFLLLSTLSYADTEISTPATNLGIGTNSVKNALSIASTLAVGDATYTTITAPTGGSIIQGNTGIGTYVPKDLFEVGLQKFTVESAGNVGVGTINPVQKLEVAGTVQSTGLKMTTNPSDGYVLVTNSVGVGTWMAPSSTGANGGTVTTVSVVSANGLAGSVANATTTPAITLSTSITGVLKGNGTAISAAVSGTDYAPATSGSSILYGNGAGGFSNVTVGSGLTFGGGTLSTSGGSSQWFTQTGTNGNVGIGTYDGVGIGTTKGNAAFVVMTTAQGNNTGIGTWNPTALLEVKGALKSASLQATAISGSTQCVQADTNGNLTGTGSACGGSGSTPGGGLNAVQYNSPVGTFAGSEAVLSMNGTNVGIGTTNGRVALEVTGNTGIGTFLNKSRLAVNGGITNGSAYGDKTALNGDIVTTGNIGAGTFAPIQALQVVGKAVVTGGGAANAPDIYSTTAGSTTGIFYPSTNQIAMSVASADALHIDNNKNVGINNASPTITLDVLSSAAPTVARFKSSGGDGAIDILDATGDTWRALVNNNDASFWIYGGSSASSKLNIKSDGNVGIGTSAALAPNKLYVGGTGEMNGFKLNGQNGASGRVLVSDSTGIGTWMSATTIPTSLTLTTTGTSGASTLTGNVLNVPQYSGGSSQWTTQTELTGNVGLSTYNAVGIGTTFGNASLVVYPTVASTSGNVGIGTYNPRAALETNGLLLSGNGAAASSVLVSNSVGLGTWMASTTLNVTATASPAGSSPQIQYNNGGSTGAIGSGGSDGTNIGIGTVSFTNRLNIGGGSVGIGTVVNSNMLTQSIVSPTALAVDGNVGIGTWKAANALSLMAGNIGIGTRSYDAYITQVAPVFQATFQSNVGIGTWEARNSLIVMSNGAGSGGGNIGIGTLAPGTSLDVNGVLRISNAGDTYFQGNIGLGTTIPMNTLSVLGNVGIGSTKYGGNVCVGGQEVGNSGGLCVSTNIGIGTLIPTAALQIFNGTANVGIGTYTSGTALCWKNCHATTGRCELGYATGTLTGNIWSGCN